MTTPTTPTVQMPPLPVVAYIMPERDGEYHGSDHVAAYRTQKAGWEPLCKVSDAQAHAAQRTAALEAKLAEVLASPSTQPAHPVSQILIWATDYEKEGGHGLIVQMLRAYASLASPSTLTASYPVEPISRYGSPEMQALILDKLAGAVVQEPAEWQFFGDTLWTTATEQRCKSMEARGFKIRALYTRQVEPTAQPTDAQIARIALANGFTLKQQPDGKMALNPYVFDFARALLKQPTPPPVAGDVTVAEITRLKGHDLRSHEECRKALRQFLQNRATATPSKQEGV